MNKERTLSCGLAAVLTLSIAAVVAKAQDGAIVLERHGRVISLVPYAPNVLRITMGVDGGSITELTWDNLAHRLKHEGAPAWSGPDQSIVTVIGELGKVSPCRGHKSHVSLPHRCVPKTELRAATVLRKVRRE